MKPMKTVDGMLQAQAPAFWSIAMTQHAWRG
jgi:hypothetical protein